MMADDDEGISTCVTVGTCAMPQRFYIGKPFLYDSEIYISLTFKKYMDLVIISLNVNPQLTQMTVT